MKKILFVVLFIIISVAAFSQGPVEGVNILKNYPFIINDEGDYSFNQYWYGFQDYVNNTPTYGQASYFKRYINSGNNVKTFFTRTKDESSKDVNVYISSLPNVANHLDIVLSDSYIYNIGLSIKASDICFDSSFNEFGFTVGIDWYNALNKKISTDMRFANSDNIAGNTLSLGSEYIKFSTKVIPPAGAKYFTFKIFASSGVYMENSEELLLAEPFMIPEALPVMDLNVVNNTSHSIYNNRFIKTPIVALGDLQNDMTCVSRVNFNSGNFPDEYSGYKSNKIKDHLYVSYYNVNQPNNIYDNISNVNFDNTYEKIGFLSFNLPWKNLSNGKYILKAQIKDNNKVIGEAETYFYVEDYNELTLPYGPYGTDTDLSINRDKDYWLKINGVSTFLTGVIDRGVTYGYLATDANGWPLTNDSTVYKSSYIPYGGADLIGANENTIPATFNGTFADFLHTINSNDSGEAFSYEEYAELGLNFVYPAKFAHLSYLGAYKQIDAINELKKQGIYVFYPMTEYYKETLSKDINDILVSQINLNGKNIYGPLNAFDSVTKIANSSDSILGYVINERVNSVDLDETIARKERLEKSDVSNPTVVTLDFCEISQLDGLNYIKNTNLNKAADIFIVNIKPDSKNNWTTAEVSNLINTDNYINYINKLDKPVIINLALAPKQSGGVMSLNGTPLSIMEMKKIYNKFKSSKKVCGIIYDNASSMRLQKINGTPKFDYNLFKIFLFDLKNNVYTNECVPIPMLGTNVETNPILGAKCGLNDLKNVFKEFMCVKKDVNNDGKDDYVYTGYSYTNTGDYDLQFRVNQVCFDLFTLDISIKKGYCFEKVINDTNIIVEPDVNTKAYHFGQNNIVTFTFLSK